MVSPLLALIEDQARSLRKRGLRVCVLTSATADKAHQLLPKVAAGCYDIVYTTPEQLQKEAVRRALEQADLNYLVIDEIHTLPKWGKTFRPSYAYLANYLKHRREQGYWIPTACFTATLPAKELQSTVQMLTGGDSYHIQEINFNTDPAEPQPLHEVEVIKGPVLRDNIEISVAVAPSGSKRLDVLAATASEMAEWASQISDTWIGLIYVGFVRSAKQYENAEYIAQYLTRALREEVLYFHGQMKNQEKKKALETLYRVSQGKAAKPRIVVATKAFGMGIDIPNIRWIIHLLIPENIEDYYQEIGRGGRDGKPCKTVLLYAPCCDYQRRLRLLKRSFTKPSTII